MQNGLGESFWDAHGVEIGACAIYDNFRRSKILKFGRASNKWKIGCSGPPAPTWPNGRAGCLRDPRSAEPLMICGLDLCTPSRPYHFGAPPTHHEPTQTRFCHRAFGNPPVRGRPSRLLKCEPCYKTAYPSLQTKKQSLFYDTKKTRRPDRPRSSR